jgi:hypothetical protein
MHSRPPMDHLIIFEHKREPMASRRHFLSRLGLNAAVALAVIVVSLAIGIAGYMGFEGMSFVDALLNASMILSTMGPVSVLKTNAGKIFASIYAIASGLLLFALAGLILAPVYHRMMHGLHLEEEDEAENRRKAHKRPSGK